LRKTLLLLLLFSSVYISVVPVNAFSDTNIKESVVKIFTVYTEHSYSNPWQMKPQGRSSGSGSIIEGKKILTNAHVVANATFVQVKKAGQAEKYTAEVVQVDNNCDLAILKVKDESFFDGVVPIKLGELVKPRDEVAVYGFPEGGDELCVNEGVVSRIEHNYYSHNMSYLLACQIDAPVNSGNSGGPVIKDDKIVGVAFESREGQNINYMVPVNIIKHFLVDADDGVYDGIPELGISCQGMENPFIRAKYKMKSRQSGILARKIYPDSPAEGILREGDVILGLGGYIVACDGTIEFRKNERTSCLYAVQEKYIGDTIRIKVLREGVEREFDIKLTIPVNTCRLVYEEQYNKAPTYYIVGGLVFEPLTYNYLAQWSTDEIPSNLFNYYNNGEPSKERREVVVLTQILEDEVNKGYSDLEDSVIVSVNGEKISTVKDLVNAIEKNMDMYHVLIDEYGHEIILSVKDVNERNKAILDIYKINKDRSKDIETKDKRQKNDEI